jgi:hypothetical protein
MELSPLAKAKLAKIGELSPEEKFKLKLSEELTTILADYFTGKMDADGLQQRINTNKDGNNSAMVPEIQVRLIRAINLSSSDIDFNRSYAGILSCEKGKKNSKFSEIEKQLNSIKSLREKYQKDRDSFLITVKNGVRKQVTQAIQQMAIQGRQNAPADIESSVEASAKATSQWREFIINHEKSFNQTFNDTVTKIASLF